MPIERLFAQLAADKDRVEGIELIEGLRIEWNTAKCQFDTLLLQTGQYRFTLCREGDHIPAPVERFASSLSQQRSYGLPMWVVEQGEW